MQSAVIFNHQLFESEQAPWQELQRAWAYADAFFDTMLLFEGRLHFGAAHLQRMEKTAAYLKLQLPVPFNIAFLEEKARALAQANELGHTARIKITVFRNSGGYYTPSENQSGYLMEATPCEGIAIKELHNVGFCHSVQLSPLPYITHKTVMKQEYIFAGLEAKENNWDEVFISSIQGRVIEAGASNILLYYEQDNALCLVNPLKYGLSGIMLQAITKFAKEELKATCTVNDYYQVIQGKLAAADAIITCNSLSFGLVRKGFENTYNPSLILNVLKPFLQQLPFTPQAKAQLEKYYTS